MSETVTPYTTYPAIPKGVVTRQPGSKLKVSRDGIAVLNETYKGNFADFFGSSLTVAGTNHPEFPYLSVWSSELVESTAGIGILSVEYRGADTIPAPTYSLDRSLSNEPLATNPKWVSDIAGKPSAPLNGAIFIDPTTGLQTTDDSIGQFKGWAIGSPFDGVEDYLCPGSTWTVSYVDYSPPDLSGVGTIQTPDGPCPAAPANYFWLFAGGSSSQQGTVYRCEKNVASLRRRPQHGLHHSLRRLTVADQISIKNLPDTSRLQDDKLYLIPGGWLRSIVSILKQLWRGENITRGPGILLRSGGPGGLSISAVPQETSGPGTASAWPWKVYNRSKGAVGQVQLNGGDGFAATLNGFVCNVNGSPNDTSSGSPPAYPKLAVGGNGVLYGKAVLAEPGTITGEPSDFSSLDLLYAASLPPQDGSSPQASFVWTVATISNYGVDGSGNVTFTVNNASNYGWTNLYYCGIYLQIY